MPLHARDSAPLRPAAARVPVADHDRTGNARTAGRPRRMARPRAAGKGAAQADLSNHGVVARARRLERGDPRADGRADRRGECADRATGSALKRGGESGARPGAGFARSPPARARGPVPVRFPPQALKRFHDFVSGNVGVMNVGDPARRRDPRHRSRSRICKEVPAGGV
ncbi:hypothetical protein BLAT2472_30595 [Burkholderia latens]